jgi:CRISPR-associated endonuclease/helicase Cas3
MVAMRQLQKYSISLRPYEFEQLNKVGAVCDEKGIHYLSRTRYYSREIGILFENNEASIW